MKSEISRRQFISRAGIAALGLPLISWVGAGNSRSNPVPGLKIGYASITWSGENVQAIRDIASLGFKGIQLRADVMKQYGKRPDDLWDIMDRHKLKLCMFSSGNANINTGNDKAVIKQHLDNARFVEALGGEFIQLTNDSRPKEGAPAAADLIKYARLLNEIGKRTLDYGVQVTYHNHMHQLGETPEEVAIIMDNCDEKYVKLLLDVAHYHQGGGNPESAIREYKSRLASLHLKDVKPTPEKGAGAYKFVELGKGEVNLPAVFSALHDIKFKGWGIIELDAVPDEHKTPLECAKTSQAYLKAVGLKVS